MSSRCPMKGMGMVWEDEPNLGSWVPVEAKERTERNSVFLFFISFPFLYFFFLT